MYLALAAGVLVLFNVVLIILLTVMSSRHDD